MITFPADLKKNQQVNNIKQLYRFFIITFHFHVFLYLNLNFISLKKNPPLKFWNFLGI